MCCDNVLYSRYLSVCEVAAAKGLGFPAFPRCHCFGTAFGRSGFPEGPVDVRKGPGLERYHSTPCCGLDVGRKRICGCGAVWTAANEPSLGACHSEEVGAEASLGEGNGVVATVGSDVCGSTSGNTNAGCASISELSGFGESVRGDLGHGDDSITGAIKAETRKADFEVCTERVGHVESTESIVNSDDLRKERRKQKAARHRSNRRERKEGVRDQEDVPVWRRKKKDSLEIEAQRKNLTASPARFIAGLVNEYNSAELATSVEAKWIAKNKLETAKVERELRLLEATDVEFEARKRNAKTKADYERHLVSIEKTHGRLLAADCIPAEDLTDEERSRVHTVGSSTISPSSSVSEAEVRAIQKKNLDLEKTNEELYKALAKLGFSRDNIDEIKSEFTCDANGNLTPESHKIAMKLSPQGYVTDYLPYQKLEPDENGKYHIGVMLY